MTSALGLCVFFEVLRVLGAFEVIALTLWSVVSWCPRGWCIVFSTARIRIRAMKCFKILVVGAICCLSAGCVERELSIASDPPGALLYLNDVEVGRTPIKVPFEWYGTYDVRLQVDAPATQPGHPALHYYLHTARAAKAPWYEYIGPDLLAELSPFKFKDVKYWAFAMEPQPNPSDQQMIESARELRKDLDTPQPLKNKK
jgi:hypothetical protein